MLPIQAAELPAWLPFRDAVAGVPDVAVAAGVFVVVALLIAGAGAFVVGPLLGLIAGRLGAHDRLKQFLSNLTTVVASVLGVLVGLVAAGFDLASGGLVRCC